MKDYNDIILTNKNKTKNSFKCSRESENEEKIILHLILFN